MANPESKNIHAKLRSLQEFETFSPFCRVFYDLIDKWIAQAEHERFALSEVFVDFLDVELRRHQAIRKLSCSGVITILNLVEIAQELRSDVERIFNRMDRVEDLSPVSRAVVNLIRAECNYHLGETEKVVNALQRSIAAGCNHPIVFLALGFNLYCRAVKSHTERGQEPDKLLIADPDKFARACAEAVDAFKSGIRGEGSPFDSKLYWWIGSVCEIMQNKQDAILAYRRAMELDPPSFTSEAMKKIAHLSPSARDAMSEKEKLRLAGLPRLTDKDIQEGANWLRQIKTIDDLLGAR
ncbi:MAG: hypothetical protein GXP25_18515 [Planctomycetes bacterium]|nr:hypothetical protein [Planctomycetota bacterium]